MENVSRRVSPASRFPAASFCITSVLIFSIPHSFFHPSTIPEVLYSALELLPQAYIAFYTPRLCLFRSASQSSVQSPLLSICHPSSPTRTCLPPTAHSPSDAASRLPSQASSLQLRLLRSPLMAIPYHTTTILPRPSPQPPWYQPGCRLHFFRSECGSANPLQMDTRPSCH